MHVEAGSELKDGLFFWRMLHVHDAVLVRVEARSRELAETHGNECFVVDVIVGIEEILEVVDFRFDGFVVLRLPVGDDMLVLVAWLEAESLLDVDLLLGQLRLDVVRGGHCHRRIQSSVRSIVFASFDCWNHA